MTCTWFEAVWWLVIWLLATLPVVMLLWAALDLLYPPHYKDGKFRRKGWKSGYDNF